MSKRSILIWILGVALLAWSPPVLAAEPAADQAENIVPSEGVKAPGDILFHCDVQSIPNDNRILGIETLRDTIFITGGGQAAPNWVHVWTMPGGICTYGYTVQQFTPETWGWRDIACDGEYLYASDDRTLECFYVTPGGVVLVPANNITIAGMADIGVVRAVAYDEDHDWFWTADFSSNIYAFNRAGTQMAGPYANAYAVYGMAYDNESPGGPFLWVHTQDSCNVRQFDPNTGVYTGVVYSGWGDGDPGVSGIAGGLCVMEGDESKGSVTLLGIMQGSPFDEMYGMEIVEADSLYWKPPYENYAPSGMPDIDMFQGFGWWKLETGLPTFDGPCAVANCFKWFDSKYEEGFGGVPGDADDQFPLVRDYLDNLPTYLQVQDDHSPENIDIDHWHYLQYGVPITPWLQNATTPPPSTTQPFVPGYQYPPQPMPPWGELVERLAWYLNVDGVQTGYCGHSGTRPQDMHDGIQDWLESETFEGTGGEQQFIRGDINADGIVDMTDVTACVTGGPFLCDDAADVNDDGVLDLTDCDYLLAWWQGGPPPPYPFPDCGIDPTADGLGCASFPPCPSLGPSLAETLCVNIWPMPTFELVETLVEKCEDVILLLGFWWQEPGVGEWWRNGGHWVTVAGINSEEFLIAFSDPFMDNAEYGGRGRVGSGGYLNHNHPEWDHWTHNDEGNVSHDVYEVIDDPISPGGLWEIVDYGVPYAPPDFIASRFFGANVPPEFEPLTLPFDPMMTLVTEVEYAIQVSPWDYRGDVAPTGGDGILDVGDAVYILNYLFKGGPAPDPFIEGDTNCDGLVDLSDAILILNYLFKGGRILRCCDP